MPEITEIQKKKNNKREENVNNRVQIDKNAKNMMTKHTKTKYYTHET